MKELRDRVVVVTGRASGIGSGMARAFVAEGRKVVIADAEAEARDAAVSERGLDPAAGEFPFRFVDIRIQLYTIRDIWHQHRLALPDRFP